MYNVLVSLFLDPAAGRNQRWLSVNMLYLR